jgi:hypothetical protein
MRCGTTRYGADDHQEGNDEGGLGHDHVKKAIVQQLHQNFDLATFDDGEIIEDYMLRLSDLATHLTTLGEEVKDSKIAVKMLRSLPPHFKQIMIKTLLNVLTMSVVDLTEWLNEVEEGLKEAPMSLQQDGKMYLTEEEWDAWWKKHDAENHSSGGARGGGASKGGRRGHSRGRDDSPLGGSSNKPTSDECRHCVKCHTQFLCQNRVLIICMTQDQMFHTYGQKSSQKTKCHNIKYNYYINIVFID